MHFLQWKHINFIKFSPKLIPKGPINNISALVIIWTNDGLFTDAYMRHLALVT